MKKRILSGVQPTGNLHLGNYLGAIKQFVALQDEAECLFCVVDLHAITVKHDPVLLAQQTREIAAAYIASGVDPQRSTIFVQSHVPAHSEMAWLLQSVARVGWLERMTQYREKTNTVPPRDLREVLKRVKGVIEGSLISEHSTNDRCQVVFGGHDIWVLYNMLADNASNIEKASVGLFTYPVLMAADILAYRATHVPVGSDQIQHLELARDIAQKFNNDYDASIAWGDPRLDVNEYPQYPEGAQFFPIPEPIISKETARIMSLHDASKKMSKSDPNPFSRISMDDDDDIIRLKVRKATADTGMFPSSEEEISKPEINNLITIYCAVTGEPRQQAFARFGGRGYGNFKPALADALIAAVGPIRDRMAELLEDPKGLDAILRLGREKAWDIAGPTVSQTKTILGMLPR